MSRSPRPASRRRGGHLLRDFVPNRRAENTDLEAFDDNLKSRLESVLASLTDKEREVLELRYGIGKDTTCTHEEIGTRFKVSRERIRQIELAALQKLRHPIRANRLQGFLD